MIYDAFLGSNSTARLSVLNWLAFPLQVETVHEGIKDNDRCHTKLIGDVGLVLTMKARRPNAREEQAPNNYQPKSLLLDELSNDLSVATEEDSHIFPACLKNHREERTRIRSKMQVPNDRDFQEEYFPLEDSFSDILDPDQNNASDPRIASDFPDESAASCHYSEYEAHLAHLPVPETAHFPEPVLAATYYPQAHATLYPQPRVTHHHHPEPQDGGGYPVAGIDYPGSNDVMLGRGGATNQHLGNIRFRQLVAEHKVEYIVAQKGEKPKIAMKVVQTWRALDPPGRFLTKSDPSLGDNSYWHDVGDKEAKRKASQCL